MTDVSRNYPPDPDGDARAMASIVVELERAIANVKSGVTTAIALVQVQLACGRNIVDLAYGPHENEAMLQGLREGWKRVAVRCAQASMQALDGPLIVWLPDDDGSEGTLQ